MAYITAYSAQFTSLAGVAWRVEIGLPDYQDRPVEISLDRDEPVIIEWPETSVSDAVQASVCTVKVVNDTDRQMMALMRGNALCSVYRDESLYWRGLIDDSVYEEPYSYTDGYVTEITFSDLGVLNRREYSPNGIMTLYDIVSGMAAQAELPVQPFHQVLPLLNSAGDHITLNKLMVNTERFSGMKQMEALDGILRSLNLRIIQKGGILVYDIAGLFDNPFFPQLPVVWQGADAWMRGGRTYGWYDISFAHDAKPVVAHGSLDPEKSGWIKSDRYYVEWHDNGTNLVLPAFYIQWGRTYGDTCQPLLAGHSPAIFFATRSVADDADSAFVALKAAYYDSLQNKIERFNPQEMVYSWRQAGELMSVTSRFIPATPGADDCQIRVSLELLLSPKYNPLEADGHGNYPTSPTLPDYKWNDWKKHIKTVYIPVKVELLDEEGSVAYHFKNSEQGLQPEDPTLYPLAGAEGSWVKGEAAWCDMALCYYKDGKEETALDGWVSNRPMIPSYTDKPCGLLRTREDGEYLPMPPEPGRIRLTVSDTINGDKTDDTYRWLTLFDLLYRWQAYRNPKLIIVRKDKADDTVAGDDVVETDIPGELLEKISESLPLGSCGKGLSPASLGLLLDKGGTAVGKLVRNGAEDTLVGHRLRSLEEQFLGEHPVLTGTARIGTPMLCSDASMPNRFLLTGCRQNLLEDTEKVVIATVQPAPDRYSAHWSDPVCATEEAAYTAAWSDPVCLHVPETYTASWSGPICAVKKFTLGPVWHEMTGV